MNISRTQQSRAWLLGLLALLAWGGTIGVTMVAPIARNVIRQPFDLLGFSSNGLTFASSNHSQRTITLGDVATDATKVELPVKGDRAIRPAFSLDAQSVPLFCPP